MYGAGYDMCEDKVDKVYSWLLEQARATDGFNELEMEYRVLELLHWQLNVTQRLLRSTVTTWCHQGHRSRSLPVDPSLDPCPTLQCCRDPRSPDVRVSYYTLYFTVSKPRRGFVDLCQPQ